MCAHLTISRVKKEIALAVGVVTAFRFGDLSNEKHNCAMQPWPYIIVKQVCVYRTLTCCSTEKSKSSSSLCRVLSWTQQETREGFGEMVRRRVRKVRRGVGFTPNLSNFHSPKLCTNLATVPFHGNREPEVVVNWGR